MDLLRSIQTHEARIDGRSIPIPPPSVRTALTLLHAAEDAADGDPGSLSLFTEAASTWLPRAAYRRLFPTGFWRLIHWKMPPAIGVSMTMQLLMLGKAEHTLPDNQQEEKQAAEVEWDKLMADYCATYSVDPMRALDTPWHFFMQMLTAADSVHAKAMLRYLTAKGLPYIDNKAEREKAMQDLQKRAGLAPPEKSPEEKLIEQKANLELLQRMFFARPKP